VVRRFAGETAGRGWEKMSILICQAFCEIMAAGLSRESDL